MVIKTYVLSNEFSDQAGFALINISPTVAEKVREISTLVREQGVSSISKNLFTDYVIVETGEFDPEIPFYDNEDNLEIFRTVHHEMTISSESVIFKAYCKYTNDEYSTYFELKPFLEILESGVKFYDCSK